MKLFKWSVLVMALVGGMGFQAAAAQTNSAVRWVNGNGAIPTDAVRAGSDREGEPLYVCRARYLGGVYPGQVNGNAQNCNIGFGGAEVLIGNYEVLVVGDGATAELTAASVASTETSADAPKVAIDADGDSSVTVTSTLQPTVSTSGEVEEITLTQSNAATPSPEAQRLVAEVNTLSAVVPENMFARFLTDEERTQLRAEALDVQQLAIALDCRAVADQAGRLAANQSDGPIERYLTQASLIRLRSEAQACEA